MESLPVPLDTSHPAVRDYLALVRLQVLTPLSLLINIAAVAVCATLASPSIAGVAHLHPTSITPNAAVIGAYVGVIFLGQIGYCLLLVVAGKPETKNALVKGVGMSLVCANFVMAVWAITWIMQWFLVSTILQGIILLLLLFSNMTLLIYHPPQSSGVIDIALIHAPLRFFLILPLGILFPLCLFTTLHLTFTPTPGGYPEDYSSWHAMAGFGVILGTNLLGLLVVVIRRDIVWCVAATWIAISIWSARPKPAPVYITSILFTALHPLGLILSMISVWYSSRRRRITLAPGDEHPGLYARVNGGGPIEGESQGSAGQQQQPEIERGPREVEDEAW